MGELARKRVGATAIAIGRTMVERERDGEEGMRGWPGD